MSIKVMTDVWQYSRASATDLLVLLALADIADDSGECWPSIAHLARKCRIDTRTTQRRIRSLEQLGEVVVIVGGSKTRRSGTPSNRYRIVVHIPDQEGGRSPGVADRQGGGETREGVAERPPLRVAERPPHTSVDTSSEPSLLPVPSSTVPAVAKPSKRDEAFDALTAVCGINADELTKSARGQVNAALKAIREASPNVTAEEFHERADEYGRRFNVALTPSSLAKHWPSLGTRQPKGAREKVVAQFGQHYTSWGTPR